jgi:hypothetical protein
MFCFLFFCVLFFFVELASIMVDASHHYQFYYRNSECQLMHIILCPLLEADEVKGML